SLITSGEITNGLASGSSAYVPAGIFDGMGAYDNGDGTITLLVNHELGATDGYPMTVQGLDATVSGGRISRFVIAKDSDGNGANGFQPRVLSGGLAYDEVKSVDPSFAKGGLSRFCSANLSEPGQFGGGRGFVDRLYFAGEENSSGRFFELDTAAADLHHLPAFGRGGWESAVAVDTGSVNTVALMLFDDTSGTANYLYLWVGSKEAASADLLRRNGIDASSGALYAWKAETLSTQAGLNGLALNTAVAGHWERLGSGSEIAALPTAAALRSLAQSKGAMDFIRIEDGDVNPVTGQQVAFNTTGGSGADLYGNTNLIDLSNAFATDGSLRTTADTTSLKVIVDADRLTGLARQGGVRNPDNIAWGRNGKLYVQEDRSLLGGTADGRFGGEEASIWEVDPLTGGTERWAQIDRAAVPAAYGQSDSLPTDIGNWESSGVIEVSHLFAAPAGTLFLSNVQAHSLTNGSLQGPAYLVEGGQIQLIQVGP
ncbi:MAG: alkaline phosphatase PhoX, partial [Cyanobacteriota bacterium]